MKKLIILYFALCASFAAQNLNDPVIAKVGNTQIHESEFLKRFELTPQFGRQSKTKQEKLKLDFLFTLIAEKLWSEKMAQEFIDTSYVINSALKFLEAMFVRDALYKIEVTNKINITAKMIDKGLERVHQNRFLNFLFSDNEQEIRKLYKLLEQGIPFDTLLSARPENNEQLKPIEIEYGQMEETTEDSVFALTIEQYTSPQLTPDGWYIFRYSGYGPNSSVTNLDGTNLIQYVKKVISKRQAKKYYYNFYTKFLRDKKVDVDSKLLKSLANKLIRIYSKKKELRVNGATTLEYLTSADIHTIENEFGTDSLTMPFLLFPQNPVSLRTFIRKIAFDGFGINKFSKKFIFNYLNSVIKKNLEYELFTREGYRRGLDKLPEVQSELNMWRSNYYFQAGKNSIMNSAKVPDSAFAQFIELQKKRQNQTVMINISKITVNDAETSGVIIKRLADGEDFLKLAAKYSVDSYPGKTNFESGYYPAEDFGEIGRVAMNMNEGETFGPLKSDSKFIIFKLIGKRKKSSNWNNEQQRQKLLSKFKQYDFTVKTAELAKKFGVQIFKDNLRKVPTTTINTFAVRVLGFGGKISAVPLLAPFTQWVEIWKSLKSEAL